MDTNNPTPEEKDQAEEKFKEEYLVCLILNGADNRCFGTIKTDLDNNMTCGSDSYPKSKYDTVVLLNSYHMSKQLKWATPLKD